MVQAQNIPHIIVEGRIITSFLELNDWFFSVRKEVFKIKSPIVQRKCMLQLFLCLQKYHTMLGELVPYTVITKKDAA